MFRFLLMSELWHCLILLGVLEVFWFYATLIIFVDNNNNYYYYFQQKKLQRFIILKRFFASPEKFSWSFFLQQLQIKPSMSHRQRATVQSSHAN